jgi:hypothetical protein
MVDMSVPTWNRKSKPKVFLSKSKTFEWIFSGKECLNLTAVQRAVCFSLLHHRTNTTGHCAPGLQELSKSSGFHESTVKEALKFLVENHVLYRVRVPNKKTHYFFAHDMEHLNNVLNGNGVKYIEYQKAKKLWLIYTNSLPWYD